MRKLSQFIGVICVFIPITLECAFLESITDTIRPQKWLCAGPFSIGARAGITGVLDSVTGFVPKEGDTLPSLLTQGGKVCWKWVELDSMGKVDIKYENVWWDTLQDIYGFAGTISVSYCWCSFNNQGRKRAFVITKGVGGFRINDKSYPAGIYHSRKDYVKTPVVLEDGENKVFLASRRKFSFKIIPVDTPIITFSDYTVPDIIKGEKLSAWAGITLLNTTAKRLNDVSVSIGGDEHFNLYEKEINNLLPLCVKKIALRIETTGDIGDTNICFIPIRIECSGEIYEDSIKLRVREKGESYKITFISDIDKSVQYFAVLPPTNFEEAKKYGLILTIHGAGCEASGQVGAYTPKDWAFVVAPTNRRPLGFDWQDWGRLDALEVLKEVKAQYPIDEDRIYLTGHSMGGHGVWHIGTTHPDLFAAIAPSAGWTRFELYVPWTMQKSNWWAEPSQIAYRNMVLREDHPLVFLENTLNLPIFILQGGADDDVNPIHARFFMKYLDDLDYNFRYMEVPGKKHWWDEKGIEGTACVNHPELMNFLKSHTRNPYPKNVIFKITDPGFNNRCYWVQIDEQELLYHDSRIETKVDGNKVDISTQNIKAFTLELTPELLEFGKVIFVVDGKSLHFSFEKPQAVHFYRKKGAFVFGKSNHRKLYKTPEAYGPIKRAYFTPFVLVYGTQGDLSLNEISFNNAWLEAWTWWRKGNGVCEVLPDTEVSDSIIQNYNLILFGGPEVNSITKRVNSSLPIQIRDGYVYFGKTKLPERDLAVEEIYPNPLNPDKFVLLYAGTSEKAEKFCHFFSTLYSGAGVPDFVVYNSDVSKKGWAGTRALGFFNQKWQLDERLFYKK